jgi:hypothetical protein
MNRNLRKIILRKTLASGDTVLLSSGEGRFPRLASPKSRQALDPRVPEE